VPQFMSDRKGAWLQNVAGRPACLIEFLDGVSVTEPTAAQAHATGAALGQMHKALADFTLSRPNSLGVSAWRPLATRCTVDGLESIATGLSARVFAECDYLEAHWPNDLPVAAIHADLFPDNVLMLGDKVGGLIDFYFACNDLMAYDVAVTHAAWCFDATGRNFNAEISQALLAGYEAVRPLSADERAALPLLAQGAALRFTSSRAYDWLNTPADALVVRKDPMAFARRLQFYAANPAIFDKGVFA
ncbi:MAG: homoserine kinase, partial [Novosphingobium sp. 16-62-11]